MKKMAVSLLCIFVIAMFLISGTEPISGNITDTHDYYEKKEMINSLQCRHGFRDTPVFRILQHLTSLDNIDQSQEQNDGYYEIKEETWCAQSFIPQTYGKLTHVEIYMKKQMRSMFLPFLFKRMNDWWNQNLGNITLSIYDTLSIKNKEPLASVTLSRDSIAKKDGWILFDVPDIDVWIGDTYYLVLHTTGGGDKNYYMWYYGNGDPYGNGMAYHNINGGEGSWYSHDFDFCFRTYGEYSGKEPDGIVNRWAVLIHDEQSESKDKINKMKNTLMHHGEDYWPLNHILVAEKSSMYSGSATNWLASKADQDDICIFYYEGHTPSFTSIKYRLDTVTSNLLIVVDCCSAVKDGAKELIGPHRILWTSSDKELSDGHFTYWSMDETGEYSKHNGYGNPYPGPDLDGKYRDGALARYDCDKNGDGWISASEAWSHASYYDRYWPGIPRSFDYSGDNLAPNNMLITYVGKYP